MSEPAARGKLQGAFGWAVAAVVGLGFYALLSAVLAPKPPAPEPEFPGLGPQPPAPDGPRPVRRALGLKFAPMDDGLRVMEVIAGGAAEAAGLLADDLLLAVDGRSLSAADGGKQVLLAHLDALGEASQLTLRVRHGDGSVEDMKVSLLPEGAFEAKLARDLLVQAVGQLLRQRRADGLWPGYLSREEPSVVVSALAAWALCRAQLPEANEALPDVLDRLREHQAEDGGLTDRYGHYQHRVYGTSLLVLACGDEPDYAAARARGRDWLVQAQVQEAHGIDCYQPGWGGWSYRDTYEANLRTDVSTARFALVALDAAGLPGDDPVWGRSRAFLDECQNLRLRLDPQRAPDEAEDEARLRDGGFAFGPRMSKATQDPVGPLVVYRSYGSATADGILSLLALDRVDGTRHTGPDLPRLDERALAALRWLASRFDLGQNPGFKAESSTWGQGIYYYWLAALADALHRAGVWSVTGFDHQPHVWAAELVRLLANLLQTGKGTFANPSTMMHEDSPTIAASLAILALASARDRLDLGQGGRLEAGERPAALPTPPAVLAPQDQDAVSRGRRAFAARPCAGCHQDGTDANGPSLAGVGAVYLGQEGSPAAARARLLRFLRDPQHVPGLLGDPRPPMPPAPSMGVGEAELEDIVSYLLSRTRE